MQMQKNKKILTAVIAILVVFTFLSAFIFTGCGRRTRAITAREKISQTQEQNSGSQAETNKENGKTDTEATSEDSSGSKDSVEVGQSAENENEETAESDDSIENEETSESEESVEDEETAESEEITEEEETAAGENAEETTADERTKYTADMPCVRDECKNLIDEGLEWVDTAIMPGDTGYENLEVRGFVSYDISQLIGTSIKTVIFSGKASEVQGTPVNNYGPMYIKSVYWGVGAISPSEFDLSGTDLINISKSNFSKSNETLKDSLQSSVNRALSRYQLCFYFKISQTDGDDESDYIQYPLSDLVLTVTYLK
jgi:hypothetical protein